MKKRIVLLMVAMLTAGISMAGNVKVLATEFFLSGDRYLADNKKNLQPLSCDWRLFFSNLLRLWLLLGNWRNCVRIGIWFRDSTPSTFYSKPQRNLSAESDKSM